VRITCRGCGRWWSWPDYIKRPMVIACPCCRVPQGNTSPCAGGCGSMSLIPEGKKRGKSCPRCKPGISPEINRRKWEEWIELFTSVEGKPCQCNKCGGRQ
jgi:hypothetical protein